MAQDLRLFKRQNKLHLYLLKVEKKTKKCAYFRKVIDYFKLIRKGSGAWQ